jgi:hypothetical protein
MQKLYTWLAREDGQTMAEYGVVLAVIPGLGRSAKRRTDAASVAAAWLEATGSALLTEILAG